MYLSSFRMGSCPDRLVALAGNDKVVAVVANAMDAAPLDVRDQAVQRELVALADLGFTVEEVDLRDHFVDRSRLAAELRRCGVVWLRGGNVFMLRYALARSGADVELIRLLHDDAIVYSGYSAGPCVLAPSLRGLETVDMPATVGEVYGEEVIWDGLGVLDFANRSSRGLARPSRDPSMWSRRGSLSRCGRAVPDAQRRRGSRHRRRQQRDLPVSRLGVACPRTPVVAQRDASTEQTSRRCLSST